MEKVRGMSCEGDSGHRRRKGLRKGRDTVYLTLLYRWLTRTPRMDRGMEAALSPVLPGFGHISCFPDQAFLRVLWHD